jgi:hypothetical protein
LTTPFIWTSTCGATIIRYTILITLTKDSIFSVRYSVSWILYCPSWQTDPHCLGLPPVLISLADESSLSWTSSCTVLPCRRILSVLAFLLYCSTWQTNHHCLGLPPVLFSLVDESSLSWPSSYTVPCQTNPLSWPSSCTVLPGRLLTPLVDECSLVTPPFLPSFFLTGLQYASNLLKLVLRVPSREHLVEQLSFPVVTQTTLVAITEVQPAVD